jgi:hypothetical protein
MHDSLWIALLAKLAWLCQHIGLDLTAGLALVSAATGSLTGWAVRRTVPPIGRLAWRGVSGACRWAFSTPELSPVAAGVLKALEVGPVRLNMGGIDAPRIRAAWGNTGNKPAKRLMSLWLLQPGASARCILPLLARRERRLIEAKAYEIGRQLQSEADEYAKTEAAEALDPPACTMTDGLTGDAGKYVNGRRVG